MPPDLSSRRPRAGCRSHCRAGDGHLARIGRVGRPAGNPRGHAAAPGTSDLMFGNPRRCRCPVSSARSATMPNRRTRTGSRTSSPSRRPGRRGARPAASGAGCRSSPTDIALTPAPSAPSPPRSARVLDPGDEVDLFAAALVPVRADAAGGRRRAGEGPRAGRRPRPGSRRDRGGDRAANPGGDRRTRRTTRPAASTRRPRWRAGRAAHRRVRASTAGRSG